MFDLFTTQGMISLAASYFVFACISMHYARKHFSSKLSQGVRMMLILFFHDVVLISVYSYKYSQNGFNFSTYEEWEVATLITMSSGYLAHLLMTYIYKCMSIYDIIHHLIVSAISIGAIYLGFPQFVASSNLFFQLTHPGLVARVIMKELNMRYTLIYEINECLYFVSYPLLRPIFSIYLWYVAIFYYKISFLTFILYMGLFCYFTYFGLKMIPLLMRNFRRIMERKSVGIQYFWFSENPKVRDLSYYGNHAKDL